MHASRCLTAEAVVVAARANGCIDLEFQPAAGCAGCAGTCLWKRLQSTRIERLHAPGVFRTGTRVSVSLPERRVLLASLLVHGLPLAAILLGAGAGAALIGTDLGTLVGAVLGIGIALVSCRPLGRRLERATLARLEIGPGI
jgi:positive regulator of sigma E activity